MLTEALSPPVQTSRWRTLARAEQLALLLDLDGTLIEFARTPAEATLDPEACDLLARLVDAGIHVVIVSGRPLDAIEPLRASVPGVWWAAEHGGWRWSPRLSHVPPRELPAIDDLHARITHLLSHPGIRVERKVIALCIHWREVAPELVPALVSSLETACDEWLEEHPAFERLGGVALTEVRHRDVHKGTVVNWIQKLMPDARLIAVGDDITDEDMFAELADGDAAVSVGPRELPADAHAASVWEARAFLRWLIDARAGSNVEMPISTQPHVAHRKRHRLLVMSNRTPAAMLGRTREVGGLVSALEPALGDERAIWLGWSGHVRNHDSRVVIDSSEMPLRARFDLPSDVHDQFYTGFCNQVIWPLFHGFENRVRYSDSEWRAYVAANERFARHALELAHRNAAIWVHDYHLLYAARSLRRLGAQGRLGLFLHVPFPSVDLLDRIPQGAEIVHAMMDFDVLGFQTEQDAANFRLAVRRCQLPHRIPEIDVFPATIDPHPYRERSAPAAEVEGLRLALGARRLLLGVDRLDYSKGIPERLAAYEHLLEHRPEWRRQVSFLQISVPTRAEIPDYAELRERVEGMVGRINGRFGDTDWVPVRYLYRSFDQRVLAQLYRLADVALVTPLRDGMNLVAKEFVAAQDPERPGALVLSKFAGAAQTLTDALLTNPFHIETLASDIDKALTMVHRERLERHRAMLATLEREGDARAWAKRFLDRLAHRRLHSID